MFSGRKRERTAESRVIGPIDKTSAILYHNTERPSTTRKRQTKPSAERNRTLKRRRSGKLTSVEPFRDNRRAERLNECNPLDTRTSIAGKLKIGGRSRRPWVRRGFLRARGAP